MFLRCSGEDLVIFLVGKMLNLIIDSIEFIVGGIYIIFWIIESSEGL